MEQEPDGSRTERRDMKMAIGHADRQGHKSYISIPRYTTVERKRDEEDTEL